MEALYSLAPTDLPKVWIWFSPSTRYSTRKAWELYPEEVFVSYPRGIYWDTPFPQGLDGKKVIPLSLRDGGSEMLVFIGDREWKGRFVYF